MVYRTWFLNQKKVGNWKKMEIKVGLGSRLGFRLWILVKDYNAKCIKKDTTRKKMYKKRYNP
jgi:hypothetical protein